MAKPQFLSKKRAQKTITLKITTINKASKDAEDAQGPATASWAVQTRIAEGDRVQMSVRVSTEKAGTRGNPWRGRRPGREGNSTRASDLVGVSMAEEEKKTAVKKDSVDQGRSQQS